MSKPQGYWISWNLRWHQDGSHEGIPTGIIQCLEVSFGWRAGSGGLACDKSHSPEVQLQQLKVEEISPFFLIFCQALDSASRYFHITVTVVTADLVFLDLPNIESVPSGEIQLLSLRLLCMKRCHVHVLDLNEVYRSATAEARHSFKPRNSISWTDRSFKFPNTRRPKGTFETKKHHFGPSLRFKPKPSTTVSQVVLATEPRFRQYEWCNVQPLIGVVPKMKQNLGGFKHFLFAPLFGEDFQFD